MKSTGSSIFAPRKQLLMSAALILAGSLALPPVAAADDDTECSLRTLRGVYLFRASGYNIIGGVALPKAIIETLIFDGRGSVSTPAVAVSVNGFIIQPPQGSPAIYTVDADCTGTLTFGDSNMFALQINPGNKSINLLQTNPGTVMQGAAERVLR
jgi:hypothetical protein